MMNVYCFFLKFISIDLSCTYIWIRPSAFFFGYHPPIGAIQYGITLPTMPFGSLLQILYGSVYNIRSNTTQEITIVMANILSPVYGIRVNIYRTLVAYIAERNWSK